MSSSTNVLVVLYLHPFFVDCDFPPTCMAVVGVRGENPQGSLRSGYLANSGSSTYPR